MRHTAILLAALAAVGGAAAADEVTVRGFPTYFGVQVVDATNGKILYKLRGKEITKVIRDVAHVKLDSHLEFNKAEDLLKSRKAAAAVAAYDKAEKSARSKPWHKRLIRYRRLRALDEARMVGRAVQEWLVAVDDSRGLRSAQALVPKQLGPRRSEENALAIRLLEQRLKVTKDVAFLARIRELLKGLYGVEGMDDKIAALDGVSASPAAGNGKVVETTDVAVSAGAMGGQLQDAANQIKAGRYAAAADGIKARLARYGDRELPTALVLRGKALLLMYEKGASRKRQTLFEAGLCFMRVAACVDAAVPEVPEALFLAAKVCRHLKNDVAAQNTYRMIISRYGHTKWAKDAEAAMGGGT